MRTALILTAMLLAGCSSTPDLVYVTPAFGEGVCAVRPDTMEVAWARAPEGPAKPGRAMHLACTGNEVWVGDLDGKGLVALDARSGETKKTLSLPHEVVGIAISPDGKTLVTAARDALEAYIVNVEDGSLRATVKTGDVAAVGSLPGFFTGHPYASVDEFAVQDNVNGCVVWISFGEQPAIKHVQKCGPVHCIDLGPLAAVEICEGTADGRFAPCLISNGKPAVIPLDADETPRLHHGCFSKDGQYYYVANMGPLNATEHQGHTIAMVDIFAHKAVKTARAGRGAGHPILSPDGTKLYVVNHAETFVSVFDAKTLEPIGKIEAAKKPAFGHGVCFTKDGALLVLASADHELVKIVNDKVVARLDLGAVLGEMEAGW